MKKKVLIFLAAIVILLGGGVVGFAAAINFWTERDGAQTEINRLFNNGNAWKNKAEEIQTALTRSEESQKELTKEINRLRELQNNSVSREEFNRKQTEVDQKQKDLEAEQKKSNELRSQLSTAQAENNDKDAAMQAIHQQAKQKADELSTPK